MTPPENVTTLVNGFNRIFDVLHINIRQFNILSLGSNKYNVLFETRAGSYGMEVVWDIHLNRGFRLLNSFLNCTIPLHSFINEALPSIIYNIANNKDTEPVETLFVALCTFWDPFFIQTMKGVPRRAGDAMRLLDNLMYVDAPACIIPRTRFREHHEYFKKLVTSPLGWRLYAYGKLGERKEIQDVISGKIF